jgi:phosphoglycerol transferase
VVVCLVVSIPVAFVYRPWSGRWRIPVDYGGDGFVYVVSAAHSNILGTVGWTSSLGAPHGFRMIDFPLGGDRFHLVMMRLIHMAVSDWLTVANLYYLLSFYLVALVAFAAFRSLRLRMVPSLVGAVLFSCLPYHFARGFSHITLAAYVGVPVLGLLVIWVLTGRLDWQGDSLRDRVHRTTTDRRWWIAFALAAFVALTSVYYTFFFLAILVLCIPAVVLLRRRLAAAVVPLILLVMTGLATVTTLLPDILAKLSEGQNTQTFQRFAGEADTYGLRLSQVLLPIPDHRIAAFGDLGQAAYRIGVTTEFGAPIGIVGVLGVVTLVLFAAARVHRRGSPTARVPKVLVLEGGKADDAGALLVGTVLAFVVSTVGGIGTIVAMAGFTQIRVWGRMTVVIGFFALGGMVMLLDRLEAMAGGRRDRRVAVQLGALAVLALGLLDQISADPTPDYDRIEAARTVDRNFVGGMAEALGAGASVLQLPYQSFPESSVTEAMPAYDQLRAHLNDQAGLEWSFGGTRGREADWQQAFSQLTPVDQVVGAAAAGFDAITLDRVGLAPGDTTESDLTALLGPPAGTSDDRRQVWFDLRPAREMLDEQIGAERVDELGRVVTRPLGLQVVEPSSRPDEISHDLPSESTLEITRYDDVTSPALLRFTAVGPAGTSLVVRSAGGERTYALSPAGTEVSVTVPMHEQVSKVHLSTDAPNQVIPSDFRSDVSLHVTDVALTDARERGSLDELRDAAPGLCATAAGADATSSC